MRPQELPHRLCFNCERVTLNREGMCTVCGKNTDAQVRSRWMARLAAKNLAAPVDDVARNALAVSVAGLGGVQK